MKYSANLGFLWREKPLADAVKAASEAGFDAVEFHWPYGTAAAELREAARTAGLKLLGINTPRGGEGQFGLGAVPGMEQEALSAFGEALDYAVESGASAIHAMAGIGEGEEAAAVFEGFLRKVAPNAEAVGVTVLLEPINLKDVPGYALHSPEQAACLIDAVPNPCLRMMYDCYHAGMSGRDVGADLERFMPLIGHIQIAAVPDRGEPDRGNLDYMEVLARIGALGYEGHIGAEYRPRGTTEAGLGWLGRCRAAQGRGG